MQESFNVYVCKRCTDIQVPKAAMDLFFNVCAAAVQHNDYVKFCENDVMSLKILHILEDHNLIQTLDIDAYVVAKARNFHHVKKQIYKICTCGI